MKNDLRVRKSFRLPLAGPDAIKAEIDGARFEVIDIGTRGIGIRVPRSDTFTLGEKLARIMLEIDQTLFSVDGIVVHISADDSDHFLCGILLELQPLAAKKFDEYVTNYRKNIFTVK